MSISIQKWCKRKFADLFSRSNWCEDSEDLKQEIKVDKKKVAELKRELEAIEERFTYGKIPENLYQKFSNKLEVTNQYDEMQ